MADSRFPRLINLPTNDKLEKLLLSTGKEGQRRDGNYDKHKYFLSLCRYTCTIPSWDQNGQLFREHFMQSLLDMALMKASENGEFLKWSQRTTPVYPVAVPDDGLSLFHAVSTAMWGLQDKRRTLKQLMEMAIPDMVHNLKARWQFHASDVKAEERQTTWSNIVARLEGRPSIHTSLVRVDEEVDSLGIFVLANIIHRPIIVIEIPSHASSNPTERFDAEGIFLPLEKSPHDCSKSPIILCHRDHQFCPLMFMSSLNRDTVFPLHKGDLSILPVRYALDRNTLPLISQYLNLQDKIVISETGSAMTLFCSSVAITSLPENFNSMNSHMKICQEFFQDFASSQNTNESVKQTVSKPLVGQHSDRHPFQYIDESNQTYVVPLSGFRRKEGNILSPPPLSVSSPHTASPYNSKASSSDKGHQEVPLNIEESTKQLIIDESEAKRESRGMGENNKCLTPGCLSDRDPGIGELCYSCFTRSTVNESGLELLSVFENGKRRYILCEALLPGADFDQQQHSILCAGYEIPSLKNVGEAQSEMLSSSFLSAVNESCKRCCHYLCSQKTYPYCHECSKKAPEPSSEQNPKQNLAPNVERGNAAEKECFPDVVLLPTMYLNQSQKSLRKEIDINSKQDENVDEQIAQNFCQSKGCHSLRHESSDLCFKCSNEGKSNGNPCLGLQIATPHHQISSSERRETLELGQAECMSHNSDENVIEISEAPSVDFRKCASPVCHTLISSSEMLCEKCQSILISHSQHHNKNEHLRGAKNDWENQQTLSVYRAGTFSGIIANSPSSVVRQPKKMLSEKISASGSKIGSKPEETPSGSKIGSKPEETPGNEREMSTKHNDDKVQRTFDPSSPTSSSTSINSYVRPQASQPTSFSRAVDNNFQKMYMQFTQEQVKAVTKCRSGLCQNYGNKLKQGYCNACFSTLSEEERHCAYFRVPQSDAC